MESRGSGLCCPRVGRGIFPQALDERTAYSVSHFSRIQLFVTVWTVAHRVLSMGLPREEYCSGLPCPPPGDPPDTGIKAASPVSQTDSLPAEAPGKPG